MNVLSDLPGIADHLIQLDDPGKARGIFEGLYQLARVDVLPQRSGQFDWTWRVRPRGAATVISGHASSGGVSLAGITPQTVLILGRTGRVDLTSGGQRFQVVPGQMAGIANAGTEVTAIAGTGMRSLNIRIDGSALASQCSALLGVPTAQPPRFEPILDLRGESGADILRLALLFEEACSRPESPLGSPHVIAHLREALLGALLVGQKSTHFHLFQKEAPKVQPRAVREAEEILAARAAEPLSISEVAELTGVGLRSLERSFKAARGMSLREFLKSQRLELAHRRLRAATPGMTVTQVLFASGFSHPGEFSLAYRKHYGESPSATLRRACGEKV